MPRKNSLGERKFRVAVADGDHITLVDRHDNPVVTIHLRGREDMLEVGVHTATSEHTTTPALMCFSPRTLGQSWPEEV